MKKYRWLVALAILIALIAGVITYLLGNRYELLALTSVEVRSELEPNTTQTDAIVGTIPSNEKVAIVECHDVKHYIVPEVKLPSGQSWYVYAGEYKVIRARKMLTDFPFNLAHGCSPLVSESSQ